MWELNSTVRRIFSLRIRSIHCSLDPDWTTSPASYHVYPDGRVLMSGLHVLSAQYPRLRGLLIA